MTTALAVSSCTLGMGDIIVPGIRLDQESFYLELPGAPQAGKKKNPDGGQEEKRGLPLKLWS